jgi:hypothetical protein
MTRVTTCDAARCLVSHIERHRWSIVPPSQPYDHIGALLADVVLQPGLNYEHVVWPRIRRILVRFATYDSSSEFLALLLTLGPSEVVNWRGAVKPARLLAWTSHLVEQEVDNVPQLAEYLAQPPASLQGLPGMGPKSLAYLRLLSGLSDFPIDRRFIRVFAVLGCGLSGVEEMQAALHRAARLLDVEPRALERTIWTNAGMLTTA